MTRILALTSLSPANHDRQCAAVRSWREAKLKVFSFNHPSEITGLQSVYKHVTFVSVEETSHDRFGKHYVPIHAMCRWAASADAPVLIINADNELRMSPSELRRTRRMTDAGICFFVRQNYDTDRGTAVFEDWGIDAFLFHGRHAQIVPDSFLCMGQPWWDYWLPLTFANQDRPIWAVEFPALFHRNHALNWSWEHWHLCALEFDRCIKMLSSDRSIEACQGMAQKARMELSRLRKIISKRDLD